MTKTALITIPFLLLFLSPAPEAKAETLDQHFYRVLGLADRAKSVSVSHINDAELGMRLLKQAQATNQPALSAELTIQDNRAVKFTPHQTGLVLDLAKSRKAFRRILQGKLDELAQYLVIREFRPRVTLTDLNSLGIQELIGQGVSDFSGSPRSRLHNIRVGAEKFNGVIIEPGEEFSFNKYLGPVTAKAGYLPELVIKPEGTVPEFGGGLCQVSSTAFRAAFFGALPISQRKNHSYAVKYYKWIRDDLPISEGMDATIYPGAVDLKFINDTGAAILVWTRIESNKLYFDFYGTPHQRQVVVEELQTYDRRTDGGLKAKVTRKVVKPGGAEEVQTFHSTYVSPDRYPRIYGYATENPNPAAPPANNPTP